MSWPTTQQYGAQIVMQSITTDTMLLWFSNNDARSKLPKYLSSWSNLPYMQETAKSRFPTIINIVTKVYFKGGMAIKSLLVAPKDKDPILKKEESYTNINVTGWSVMKSTLESLQEHLERGSRKHQKAPCPIYDCSDTTGHTATIENFSRVGREDPNLIRTIKEALYTRVYNPSLNRNIGNYHLPHIWDDFLFYTSELKLNKTDP